MKDVEIMFDNAKTYNREDSQIYKDAVDLQVGISCSEAGAMLTSLCRKRLAF